MDTNRLNRDTKYQFIPVADGSVNIISVNATLFLGRLNLIYERTANVEAHLKKFLRIPRVGIPGVTYGFWLGHRRDARKLVTA
jgi:hypothetical protein